MVSRLKAESDGSRYAFLSLDRLDHLEAKKRAGTLRERPELVNNVLRDCHKIQLDARKLLAERREVENEKIEWVEGSLHDCRKTFGTHAADVVPMHVLKEYMGHANIETTAKYYLQASDAHAERLRTAFAGGVADINLDITPPQAADASAPMEENRPSGYAKAV